MLAVTISTRTQRLQVDWENTAPDWWAAFRAQPWTEVPAVLLALYDGEEQSDPVDEQELAGALAYCATFVGWTGGPKYAPHPLSVVPR